MVTYSTGGSQQKRAVVLLRVVFVGAINWLYKMLGEEAGLPSHQTIFVPNDAVESHRSSSWRVGK